MQNETDLQEIVAEDYRSLKRILMKAIDHQHTKIQSQLPSDMYGGAIDSPQTDQRGYSRHELYEMGTQIYIGMSALEKGIEFEEKLIVLDDSLDQDEVRDEMIKRFMYSSKTEDLYFLYRDKISRLTSRAPTELLSKRR